MESAYEAKKYEQEIYKRWETGGFFAPEAHQPRADNRHLKAKTFCITLPPPNVTGSLHMGHALNGTIQDILIRFYRMNGYRALWVPGTDHAGIATQYKVEQKLAKEGIKRFELGREKFLEKVWQWKDEFEATILGQLKTLGFSCDWSRKRFTMDQEYSDAVLTAFKKYWDKGYIYRGTRVVNWCPRCCTSLSDLELEYKEEKAKLYWIKYGPFVLATTRPETKLGDTAVAVNPKDKRYKEMIGKKYKIPGVCGEFEVTVVADPSVDMEFGSGAVKVTPAHDAADAEIALRHNLPSKQIIDEHGRMMANCGKYAGMKTAQAREVIVEDMKKMGLIDHIDENYIHNNAHCYRCGAIIEPIPSTQWFVKMKELSKLAITPVKDKKIRITPERYEKLYLDWLSKVRDWCISRQLWWGHRLPVWFKKFEKPVEITYFVHGSTKDNENELASGQSKIGLSKLGQEQAEKLKELIKNEKFDAVFSSDLERAVETTKIAFSEYNIIQDKRLRECDYGKLTQKSIKKFKSKEFYIENKHPDGESAKDVENRIRNFLLEIGERYSGKKIAIIAHAYTQLAIEILVSNKTWKEAIEADWRKTKKWQPGWHYQLNELIEVDKDQPGNDWQQSEDVLDTWFSSALWPFAILGWPGADAKIKNKNEKIKNDLEQFYPTQFLSTAQEILYLWVARMVFSSLEFTGQIPFENVYIHPTVLALTGKRMSKSLGTGVDPLEIADKYGADSVRMGLMYQMNREQQAFKFDERAILASRNFINKLWNVSRFIFILNNEKKIRDEEIKIKTLTLADKWILSRLYRISGLSKWKITTYQFGETTREIYEFVWHELADWYLEISKLQSQNAKLQENTTKILHYSLLTILKLLHPIVPFVTEAIWQEIIDSQEMLIVKGWPQVDKKFNNQKNEADFEKIKNLIIEIRNWRKEQNIQPKDIVDYKIKKSEKIFSENKEIIEKLGRVKLI